jgi:RNA polymerase sigma factor (sigma-70 family)
MIRVSIVEDHRPTRESLAKILRHSSEIEVVAAYCDAEEAESEIPKNLPDVVLMDINLGGSTSGIGCVTKLKRAHPEVEYVMLTTYDDTDLIFSALRAGASGYLLKRAVSEELLTAIEEVHAGGSPMSTQIARRVVSHFHEIRQPSSEVEKLSHREREILELLVKGLTYSEISQRIHLSVHTVHNYLRRIYAKLHVQSGTEAVAKYLGK